MANRDRRARRQSHLLIGSTRVRRFEHFSYLQNFTLIHRFISSLAPILAPSLTSCKTPEPSRSNPTHRPIQYAYPAGVVG